ncbi:MAG: DUF1640 domain-containing protein [Alphaproteobacteria bacterium]
MATTFDKLAYVEKLKAGGITPGDAKPHADALDEALRESISTKADLRELELSLKLWTAGLAGIVVAALPAIKFFGH